MVILRMCAYFAIIREEEVRVSFSLELCEERAHSHLLLLPGSARRLPGGGRGALSWQFQIGLDVLGFGFPHVLEMPAHQVPIGWRRLQLEVL